jgi:peptide/nickel transport system ATP-binding protein
MVDLLSSSRNDELLRIEDARIHYRVPRGWLRSGLLKAVDGVSLSILPGQCVGLVGESGCGKSSLAQAIVGITRLESGRILLEGEPLTKCGRGERLRRARKVQMVWQDPFASLNPRRSIAAQLEAPLRLHGFSDRRDRVMAMIARVGLRPDAAHRLPHEFSGGQRQRIAIARALIAEPKLVVCDEPLSALDVSIRAQIINLLLELQHDLGLSLLMISHDLAVVEHMCDRVAVMYLGRIVEEGDWREIFEHSAHPYTRSLIDAVAEPLVAGAAVNRLTGEPPSPFTPPAGCAFHPRCPHPTPSCRVGENPELLRVSGAHWARCPLIKEI